MPKKEKQEKAEPKKETPKSPPPPLTREQLEALRRKLQKKYH